MKKFISKIKKIDILFALVVIGKVTIFYLLTGLTKGSIAVGLITFATIAVAFYSLLFSQNKSSKKAFIIIYSFISILMFVDCCYYCYFNQLTSVNQILQFRKLGVIEKSFKFVITPLGTLLVLDIPFVVWYFIKLKYRVEKIQYTNYKRHRRIALTSLMAMIMLIVVNPLNVDTVKAINHNEVMTYHLYDIYTNIFGEHDNEIKSEEDVLNAIAQNQGIMAENPRYNGIGKGRNLIVVQVESLGNFALNRYYEGQELTPNLNKLIADQSTIYFDNYYQTLGKGNTSDAEFSTLNSIYPNLEGSCYEVYTENTYNGLPWLMRQNGYYSIAFHGYIGEFWNREESYKYQGFQDFISAEDFVITDEMGYGMVDEDMFEQTVDYMKELQQPFFGFVVTLSSHHPYEVPEQFSQIDVLEEHQGNEFGNYMQAVNYTDRAIGTFLEELKKAGLYENSVIVFYGDHFALNAKREVLNQFMTEFLGRYYDYDEMLNIPLMIHIPGENIKETISTTGGEVDFLPTILNIMGIENSNPYVFGRDLVNVQDEGFVASVTYLLRGSFVKGDVMFEFSKNGIFEESRAWNTVTGEVVDIEGMEEYYERAKNLVDASKYVLENDLIEREALNE